MQEKIGVPVCVINKMMVIKHFNFQIKKYAKIMEFFHHFPGIVPGVCVYPLSQIKTQVQYFFHWLSLNYNPHFLHHHLFISIFSFCYDDNNNNTEAVSTVECIRALDYINFFFLFYIYFILFCLVLNISLFFFFNKHTHAHMAKNHINHVFPLKKFCVGVYFVHTHTQDHILIEYFCF